MSKRKQRIAHAIEQIDHLIEAVKGAEALAEERLQQVHPSFEASARNLVHYRELRRHDLRSLQKQLGHLGLSRLAKAEGHVLASLYTTKAILQSFLANKRIKIPRANFSIKAGQKHVNRNAKALLGYRSKGRRTRIMVTLPSEAAIKYQMVHDLVGAGMNSARINCAHDGPEAWKQMIDHVRKASEKHQRNCKIFMDLGGPKIRTGPLEDGPAVVKFRPERDALGRPVNPARVWLSPNPSGIYKMPHLPVTQEVVDQLAEGDRLRLKDTRAKERELIVTEKTDNGCWVTCDNTTYVTTGISVQKVGTDFSFPIGEIPAAPLPLTLRIGDTLWLRGDGIPGRNAQYDEAGTLLSDAFVSITLPEILGKVKAGEPILFDDGKIGGIMREASADELKVEITYARATGTRLQADKGINFPVSDLGISGLTEKDREDLKFVAQHADGVNFSFVNRPEDVEDLLSTLKKIGAKDTLGITLKIETQAGFNQLTDILLTAMQVHPVGVMIARGDLAIEVGWEHIGRVQEEMLALCRAAHIPDIWATQVLERLAKKGLPSRAEITDAVMAQRADCVMLNKGPHILQAISLLDTILKDRYQYQIKNAPFLPIMEQASEEVIK